MNIDNLTEEQIKSLETQKAMMKFSPSGIHPDRVTIENMSDEQAKIFESMVLEKRIKDTPYKEYFNYVIEKENLDPSMNLSIPKYTEYE